MESYVVLLRGINVGGHRKIKDLKYLIIMVHVFSI